MTHPRDPKPPRLARLLLRLRPLLAVRSIPVSIRVLAAARALASLPDTVESVRDIARMAGISEKTARVLIRCGAAEQAGGPDPAGQNGETRNGQHGASADAAPAGERVGTDLAVPAQVWS